MVDRYVAEYVKHRGNDGDDEDDEPSMKPGRPGHKVAGRFPTLTAQSAAKSRMVLVFGHSDASGVGM